MPRFYWFAPLLLALSACSLLKVEPSEIASRSQVASESPGAPYAAVFGEQSGAVATVNPLATRAALDAFAEGGNAIDAAIAAAFTLGVVDSHNSGIGGGCFILARLANGEVIALDGREQAPAAASAQMYLKDGQVQTAWSRTGALASGIPGSVAAYYELQKVAGKLDFAALLQPAATIAEQGFRVDRTLAQRLARTQQDIARFPETAAIFLPEGEALETGDLLVQEDLAKSYRKLASQGPDWFYRGEFAAATGQWMGANDGLITAEDFDNYQLIYRTPVRSEFHGYEVYGFPPPSSGGVHVAQVLNIIDQFDLTALSDAQRYHLLAEALRLAFADRAFWLGDSDFVAVPEGISDVEYARQLAKRIDLGKAADRVTHGEPSGADASLLDKHTTHIATADAEGNWVAITTTLNTSFGSKVVVPGTGVLLNNQMDDFTAQPEVANAFDLVGYEANAIAPGKRPLSSMSPTIVLDDGQPILTLGAAGGPTIISQVVQVLMQRLGLKDTLEEAMAHPRIHHQWQPNLVFAESKVPESVVQSLKQKGHDTKEMGSFGGTQAIELLEGRFIPITEPRVVERNKKDAN